MVQVVASICCMIASTVARAQVPAAVMPPDAATAVASKFVAPSDTEAINAFFAARAWLDADRLPDVDATAARVALPETTAVCVVLRLDGRVVGVGDDASTDAASNERMVRRATGRAVAQALGDETIRAVRASLGDRITARLSLEIEVAGAVVPLLGRTIAEAAVRVEPGLDGVAVLRAGVVTRAFPARMLAYDNALRSDATLTALLVSAGLPVKELTEFDATDRVSLGRFRTIRLRQADASSLPVVVTRAGRVLELNEITPAFTRSLATQLCARLCGQVIARVPADPSKGSLLLGTYQPAAETYNPPAASERDTAFAAFALSRAAECEALPKPTRERATAQALVLARTLASSTSNMHLPAVDAFAHLVLSTADAPTSADILRRGELCNRLMTAAAATNLDPELAALLAASLAASDAPAAVARANEVLRDLLARHEASVAPLIDAALALALLLENTAVEPAHRVRVSQVLVEIAAVLASLQISHIDGIGSEFPSDLEGGLLLPRYRSIRSDSQCLRLAAAMAIGLANTSARDEPIRALLNQRFMRFLAQHVADDPWTNGYRSADSFRGLVRATLASSECPPAATAAGLLFATSAAAATSPPSTPPTPPSAP